MVTFNLYHGQSRIATTAEGVPIRTRWRQMSRKRALIFNVGISVETRRRFDADENGDVVVSEAASISHIATLGYPVRNLTVPPHEPACAGLCILGYGHKDLLWRRGGPSDPLAAALPDSAVHATPWRHVRHSINVQGELKCWCEVSHG